MVMLVYQRGFTVYLLDVAKSYGNTIDRMGEEILGAYYQQQSEQAIS